MRMRISKATCLSPFLTITSEAMVFDSGFITCHLCNESTGLVQYS